MRVGLAVGSGTFFGGGTRVAVGRAVGGTAGVAVDVGGGGAAVAVGGRGTT